MTLAGFELYRVNLNMTLNAFSFDFAERVEDFIRRFEERLNPFPKTLMSLSYMKVDSLITILAFLIVALVVFILALYLSKNQSSERSGYMIANKKLGVFCKLMASLTLANLMTSILASVFVQKISPVIVIIFILALLISYKFFDMLFKIRLKF